MLIFACFQKTVVAADVIVMPRSCSCSIQSMVAAPFVHFAHFVNASSVIQDPLSGRRLPSINVGHDANITDIFKFVICRSSHLKLPLPFVMGESFISFGHSMGIIFLLDGRPLIVEAIGKLTGKSIFHRTTRFRTGVIDDPTRWPSMCGDWEEFR